MASLHDNSDQIISELFENITNNAYEKYKTPWDKSPWKYFCKLPKEDKLEIIKLFMQRICSLSNIEITKHKSIFYIHEKSFKIYISISPNQYGVYKKENYYLLGKYPWKTDYLMFINISPKKIYITILKNFTEKYYRITSSTPNFVHNHDFPIHSIEWNNSTNNFFILIEKSNHTFVIDSTKNICDIDLFRDFIYKQIPINNNYSNIDLSYNQYHLRAITNYETFYHLEPGTININIVGNSSAGIDGWAK